MQTFSINTSSLNVSFTCPKCEEFITETLDDLPMADFTADSVKASENSDEFPNVCPECGAEFKIDVIVNMYEGNLCVYDDNDDVIDCELEEFAEDTFDEEPED
jgi:predicted RNA-binding Zn-ribbon protein involved in translation (DUF1610 family)